MINGLSFAISDPEPVLEAARSARDGGGPRQGRAARPRRGRQGGQGADDHRGRPGGPVFPKARMAMAMAADAMPIEAGEQELSVTRHGHLRPLTPLTPAPARARLRRSGPRWRPPGARSADMNVGWAGRASLAAPVRAEVASSAVTDPMQDKLEELRSGGTRRTTPAPRARSSASTPRARCWPGSASSTCSTPAPSRSSTCWPATGPTPPAWRSGPTPTASSPAGARSTAARCSSSARTSPSSAARSARCSPRRSTS